MAVSNMLPHGGEASVIFLVAGWKNGAGTQINNMPPSIRNSEYISDRNSGTYTVYKDFTAQVILSQVVAASSGGNGCKQSFHLNGVKQFEITGRSPGAVRKIKFHAGDTFREEEYNDSNIACGRSVAIVMM